MNRNRITILSLALCTGTLCAWGQQSPPPGQAPVSDQAVGRVSVVQGEVSTQRGDSGDWIAAAINAPVVSGDKLATGDGARTELQLDFADVLRLDANSTATLANLGTSQLQVQVGQGRADLDVLRGATAESEIDTPNLAIHPKGPGVYRIEVLGPDQTLVTVRSGDATVSTPQGSTDVHAGQAITVQGTDNPQYQMLAAGPRDAFDQWNADRDAGILNAHSRSSANGYYTGVSDLDAYGHWMLVPGYGQVWVPNGTDPNWSPYSVGRWVWEPYYGWTWVSAEPWGWAPYHYGRWFMYDAAWVWWPGPVTPLYRPVYAPAYVTFFGFNAGGVSVGVGFGSMGWLPIGPADPFRPWYGPGMRGVTVVNVTVIEPLAPVRRYPVAYSNVELVQTDPRMARAVVVVDSNRFGQGVVVRQTVTVTDIRAARPVQGMIPVVPTRDSLKVSDREVNTAALPRAAVAPVRFAGTRPPAIARPTFDQQRAEVQQRVGGAPAAARAASAPAPAAGRAPATGWHSFGTPGGSATPAGRATPAAPSPAERPAETGRATPAPAPSTTATPARGAAPAATQPAPAQKDGNWHAFTPAPAKKTPPPKPAPDDKKGGGGK